MVDFYFDEGKSFDENCKAFLDEVEAGDPEMAAILRDNWNALVVIVREGERNTRAREEFNASVLDALNALADKSAEPKGGA